MRKSLILLSLLIFGCAASIQNLSKLQYKKEEFTKQSLVSDGLVLLPITAGEGMEGYRRPAGDSLYNAIRTLRKDINVLDAQTSLNKINDAQLADKYAELIRTYAQTAILNKESVKSLSEAIGKRYLMHVRLERFYERKATQYSFWTGFTTLKEGEVGLFAQIWDGQNGDVVWEALGIAKSSITGELSYIKGFEEHLNVACRGLAYKLP